MARGINQGDIYWCRFDPPNKPRPVVVLTRDVAIPLLSSVTIAPITSQIRDIPSEVYLDASHGLPSNCAVNLDNIQTIPKKDLGDIITRLPHEKMLEVREAIIFALGLDWLEY